MILELHKLREHILAMHVCTNTDKSSTDRAQTEMLWKGSAGYWGKTSLRHQGGGEIIPPYRWQSNVFLLPWAAKWSAVQMDGSWWYLVQWQRCVAGKAEIYDTCAKSASKKVWASRSLPLRSKAADNTLLWEGAVSMFRPWTSHPCPARTFPCQMQGTCFRFLDTECPLITAQMSPPEQTAPRDVFEFITQGRYVLYVLNKFSVFCTGLQLQQQIHNSWSAPWTSAVYKLLNGHD